MFTFAVVAHNEEATVSRSAGLGLDAAKPGDKVLVVDSASTDSTAEAARRAGVEVISGPIGKGAAMATAIEASQTEWICFLDADYLSTDRNVAELLRVEAVRGKADQVIGDYAGVPDWFFRNRYGGGVRPVYRTLHNRFFPEVPLVERPLAGARAIRTSFLRKGLPSHYGIEAYLNIEVPMLGGVTTTTPVGRISTVMKENPHMAAEVAETVLDQAVRHGRLELARKSAWLTWTSAISALAAGATHEVGYRSDLGSLLARPVPD